MPEQEELEARGRTPEVAVAEETGEQKLARETALRSAVIKTLRLWCILDPGTAVKNVSDADLDVSWVNTILSGSTELKRLMEIKELKGYVFPDEDQENGVIIYDWVSVCAYWVFEVSYNIPGICRVLLLQASRIHCHFQNLGGVLEIAPQTRFARDGEDARGTEGRLHLWRDRPLVPVRLLWCPRMCPMPTEPFRAPTLHKGSRHAREQKCLIELETLFPIILSPAGCHKQGAKLLYIETIDEIAVTMGTGRPKTVKVEDLRNPPPGLVLKREYSGNGKDVYVPTTSMGQEDSNILQAVEWLKERANGSKDYEGSWFAQELVPFLRIGEFRFVCVGGVPIRDFVTGKSADGGLWSYERNVSLKAISALQWVFWFFPHAGDADIICSECSLTKAMNLERKTPMIRTMEQQRSS
jgi:hypothetical protein